MQEEIREVLKKAYQIEVDGYTFYSMAADRADKPAVQELFDQLAHDEVQHKAYLKSVIGSYEEKGAAAFTIARRDPDLKAFTDRFYHKICGAHLAPVLETLEYLVHETDVWVEITDLLIPGENDADSEIDAMTRWIADNLGPDVPLHFTAFHPSWKMMDTPSTPKSTLTRCREIGLRNGLHYVYTGNVHDREGDTTYCAGCGTKLIERNWYELGAYHLDGNRCPNHGVANPPRNGQRAVDAGGFQERHRGPDRGRHRRVR